jgi:MOSC domain-containing protein YiiM
VERRSEKWTIHRLWHQFYIDPLNADALRQISVLPSLAQGWRDHAASRVASGAVEDWSRRLEGPAS